MKSFQEFLDEGQQYKFTKPQQKILHDLAAGAQLELNRKLKKYFIVKNDTKTQVSTKDVDALHSARMIRNVPSQETGTVSIFVIERSKE